jgi:hypothetical protein
VYPLCLGWVRPFTLEKGEEVWVKIIGSCELSAVASMGNAFILGISGLAIQHILCYLMHRMGFLCILLPELQKNYSLVIQSLVFVLWVLFSLHQSLKHL